MFKIISIMFVGLGAGYLLRDLKLMRKTEKTIPLTVFAKLHKFLVCNFWIEALSFPIPADVRHILDRRLCKRFFPAPCKHFFDLLNAE